MIDIVLRYCVDSLCAVRLDNRLLKIQKRFVPEETINLTSYKPNEEMNSGSKRRTSPRKCPSIAAVTQPSSPKKPAKCIEKTRKKTGRKCHLFFMLVNQPHSYYHLYSVKQPVNSCSTNVILYLDTESRSQRHKRVSYFFLYLL